MHGLAVQTLGGIEFQELVGPEHIDGTDLRDHVGGDMDDDTVQARLCADRLRHDFAEPAQEQTGSAVSAMHGSILSSQAERCARASPGAGQALHGPVPHPSAIP